MGTNVEKIREHLRAIELLLGDEEGEPEEVVAIKYHCTRNYTRQMWADVSRFGAKVVERNVNIIEEKNCVNGTFFGWSTKAGLFPTSILVVDGRVVRKDANHLPYPQSTFIVYSDNTVEMKKLHSTDELDLKKVKFAVGGVGLKNNFDPDFEYAPDKEGFRGIYADILRSADKTVIGYRKADNCIYLMTRPNIPHESPYKYDLRQLVNDCWYDIALSIDGGGSTMMRYDGKYKMYGDGRSIHSIVGFDL